MLHVNRCHAGCLHQATNGRLSGLSCSCDLINPGGKTLVVAQVHMPHNMLRPTVNDLMLSCSSHCVTVWCCPAVVCSIAELLQLTSLHLLHGGVQPGLDISHWSSLRSLAELKLLPGEDEGLGSQQVGGFASTTRHYSGPVVWSILCTSWSSLIWQSCTSAVSWGRLKNLFMCRQSMSHP
jgi:hypothetical protein